MTWRDSRGPDGSFMDSCVHVAHPTNGSLVRIVGRQELMLRLWLTDDVI